MTTTLLYPVGSATIDAVEVDIEGGSTRLNSASVPYATATLRLPLLDDETLEWLDPRDGVRIPYEFGDETGTPRTCDLGLRSRVADHELKSVTLTLAGDEAILIDYASLTVDNGARAHEASLRDVCDYVLGKIGAALEAGAEDADVTAYWSLTNIILDPECSATTHFTAAQNTGAVGRSVDGSLLGSARIWWEASAAGSAYLRCMEKGTVSRGQTWTFAVGMRAGQAAGATGRIRIEEVDQDGIVMNTVLTTPVTIPTTGWATLSASITIAHPATVGLRFAVAGVAVALGNAYTLCAPRAVEASEVVPPFSGGIASTGYTVDWAGDAHASPSTRTPIVARRPELFRWEPGTTAWDFLMPLTSAAGMVLWCDEQRHWRLATPEARTIVQLVVVSTGNTRSGTDALDLDDEETFVSGVAVTYRWRDEYGTEQEAWDTAGTPEKVLLVELNRPYPGPGAATAILARRQGTGRRQEVDTITQIDTTPGMTAQISLPGAPDTIGRVASVDFDHASGFMTLGMAGLVDIIPGSVDALPGTVDALVGTVDSL